MKNNYKVITEFILKVDDVIRWNDYIYTHLDQWGYWVDDSEDDDEPIELVNGSNRNTNK